MHAEVSLIKVVVAILEIEAAIAPDFVNASPKLRFAVREAEKWLDCEVLLRKEECLSEVSPVL